VGDGDDGIDDLKVLKTRCWIVVDGVDAELKSLGKRGC